jgi:hypothetical protein
MYEISNRRLKSNKKNRCIDAAFLVDILFGMNALVEKSRSHEEIQGARNRVRTDARDQRRRNLCRRRVS